MFLIPNPNYHGLSLALLITVIAHLCVRPNIYSYKSF